MPSDANWQLTAEEAALVEQHLEFYRALDSGERPPTTAAQRHFVAVCRCREKAETIHEIAYVKYRAQAASRRAKADGEVDGLDEFGEQVPKPDWFRDADWKRMRSQYLSNSD